MNWLVGTLSLLVRRHLANIVDRWIARQLAKRRAQLRRGEHERADPWPRRPRH